MARIRTKEAFLQYINLNLGFPLIEVPLQQNEYDACDTSGTTGTTGTTGTPMTGSPDAELKISGDNCQEFAETAMVQINLACDDALDYFALHGAGVGNEKALLLLKLEANRMVYTTPHCIVAVEQPLNQGIGRNLATGGEEFDGEESAAGAGGLFSFESTIGGVGVSTYLSDGSSSNLLTYEIAAEYIAMVDLRYSIKFEVDFSETEKQVVIYPTPSAGDAGRVLAFRCSRVPQDEKLLSHLWVQRYAVALAKIQVGMNMSLYTGFQLPNGGEFNSQFYFDTGREEKERLEEELQTGKWGNGTAGGLFFTG